MSGDGQTGREVHSGYYTSIYDESLNWLKRGLNVRVSMLPIGEDGDSQAPLVAIIRVNEGPGDPLRGRHSHPADAINLVVDGALYMDGKWLRPGQAKIVPARLNYGDATPCSDGCIFLEIFATHEGGKPDFDDPRDQAYFEEVHGQYM